jgi:hypothetical protein
VSSQTLDFRASQIPEFRRFMTSGLRRFKISDLLRFVTSGLRKFAKSGLHGFKIPDLLRINYPESSFHEFCQTRRFEGDRFFLNSPTVPSPAFAPPAAANAGGRLPNPLASS